LGYTVIALRFRLHASGCWIQVSKSRFQSIACKVQTRTVHLLVRHERRCGDGHPFEDRLCRWRRLTDGWLRRHESTHATVRADPPYFSPASSGAARECPAVAFCRRAGEMSRDDCPCASNGRGGVAVEETTDDAPRATTQLLTTQLLSLQLQSKTQDPPENSLR